MSVLHLIKTRIVRKFIKINVNRKKTSEKINEALLQLLLSGAKVVVIKGVVVVVVGNAVVGVIFKTLKFQNVVSLIESDDMTQLLFTITVPWSNKI